MLRLASRDTILGFRSPFKSCFKLSFNERFLNVFSRSYMHLLMHTHTSACPLADQQWSLCPAGRGAPSSLKLEDLGVVLGSQMWGLCNSQWNIGHLQWKTFCKSVIETQSFLKNTSHCFAIVMYTCMLNSYSKDQSFTLNLKCIKIWYIYIYI